MPFTFGIPPARDRSKSGLCRIVCTYYFEGKTKRWPAVFESGEVIKVPCEYWNNYHGDLPRKERYGRVNTSHHFAAPVNDRLDELQNVAEWILHSLRDSGVRPSARNFKEAWDRYFSENDVFLCLSKYTEQKRLEGKKKNTLDNLRKLEIHLREFDDSISFDDFNNSFPAKFRARLSRLSPNSITLDLRNIRAFLHFGLLEKWHKNEDYKSWKFERIETRKFYLTIREVRDLMDYEFTGAHDQIRDIYIFLVFSGLRWSELSTIKEIKGESDFIRLFRYRLSKQTHEKYISFQPSRILLEIWDRYSGQLPLQSPTHTRRIIKELGQAIDMPEDRYKQMTIHTSRHTFTTMGRKLGITKEGVISQTGQTGRVVDGYDHSIQISQTTKELEEKFRKSS